MIEICEVSCRKSMVRRTWFLDVENPIRSPKLFVRDFTLLYG